MMKFRSETTDGPVCQSLLEKGDTCRAHPTEAESLLWKYLCGDQLRVHFRLLHSVYGYLSDFVCLPLRLLVELDGGCHLASEQAEEGQNVHALAAYAKRYGHSIDEQ